MTGAPRQLTWGLAVATYKRRDMLGRCVTCALGQTRPPAEIVIVDATPDPDHDTVRTHIASIIEQRSPGTRFAFERARRPQQTVQRNQAAASAQADVLFMIDDDSLMYPTCAERIMAVYERPGCEQVVSVMAAQHAAPPDDPGAVLPPPAQSPSRIAGFINDALKGPFFPPFGSRPEFATPDFGGRATRIADLHGARITVRRAVALQRPFDEALLFNAHEDRDAAWGFRGHGVLAETPEPLICHAEAVRQDGVERRGFIYRGAWLLNYVYLLRKWCPDKPREARAQALRFARGMAILDRVKSLKSGNPGPVRGIAFVRRELLPELLSVDQSRLSETAYRLSQQLRDAAEHSTPTAPTTRGEAR